MGVTRPPLLCSASPRRATLLASAGIPFELGPPPDVDETPPRGIDPGHVALGLALRKALRASSRAPDRTVLTADTTVILDESILDKPRDVADAVAMLGRLSGRTHRVVTGVAAARAGHVASTSDEARVTFRPLTSAEIEAYVATKEPFGKAGGYAIQGGAARFVARLEGDVETVVGLPTRIVRSLLEELDVIERAAGGR